MSKKALFLDRDGVINKDLGYISKKEDFDFIDGIFDLVKLANNNNYLVFVITNQSGISRGYYTEDDFIKLTEWMKKVFISKGAFIKKVFYCTSLPFEKKDKNLKENYRRKPNPGMIMEAKKEFNVDLTNSILVGDKLSDIQAGKTAEVGLNILLEKNYSSFRISKNCKKVKSLHQIIPLLN